MDDVTISFSHDGALDAANAKIDVTTSGTAVVTDATSADLGSGEVKVTISNTKEITLPITGMTPNQLATSVGMILVVAGSAMLAIHVSRSRKGAESK